jgi:hypothetical protein
MEFIVLQYFFESSAIEVQFPTTIVSEISLVK